MTESTELRLPLAGIKVLEFSQTVMGPCAGLVLADMGAEVIKIEAVPNGDPTRSLGGFGSGMFLFYNRNKRSIAIDGKTEQGQKVLHALVRDCDVVIENFALGAMERLGCGWETLSALNPRLVYLTLKGFLSGPYEKRAALDEVAQFMGGLAYMTGPRGRPHRAGASITDITGGIFGAMAVVAALYERTTTGRGKLVKSSLYESVAFMMGQFMAGEARQGYAMPPLQEREIAWPVYDTFTTSENEIVFIAVTSFKLWTRFVEVFGLPELRDDPRLATMEAVMNHHGVIVEGVAARVAGLTVAEVGRLCEETGCGWAHAAKPGDLFDDPQLNAGHLEPVEIMGRKSRGADEEPMLAKLPRLPIELDGKPLVSRRQPPKLGEHTREILAEAGLSRSDIDAALRDGIVREPAQ